MKDSNDNKTIDFINSDNKEYISEFMILLSSILIKTSRLTKKDNDVFLYIILNNTNHLNLTIDIKKIAEKLEMPATNIYRHVKKLESKNVIIKNDNSDSYKIDFSNSTESRIKDLNNIRELIANTY